MLGVMLATAGLLVIMCAVVWYDGYREGGGR